MKILLSIIIALMTIAYGNSIFALTKDTVKTSTVKVEGITCELEMTDIKKKLINQPGVDEVTYSKGASGMVTFTVKYHTSIITAKKIKEVIESAPSCENPNEFPYKVKSIKDNKNKDSKDANK